MIKCKDKKRTKIHPENTHLTNGETISPLHHPLAKVAKIC